MLDGSEVFGQIDQRARQARAEADAVTQRLDVAVAQLAATTLERLRATRALAELRVTHLRANEFVADLDHADRAALAALEKRSAKVTRLDAELVSDAAAVAALTLARATCLAARDAADEALDELERATQTRLRTEAIYTQAEAATKLALDQATKARTKCEQARGDREKKRRPYESDRLFTYLWQRRYGAPSYASTGVVRALDGWVARLVRYDEARRNYHLLLSIADRLDEHAAALEARAAECAATQAAIEERALVAAGAGDLRSALATREKELTDVEAQLARCEVHAQTARAERERFTRGEDEHTSSAINGVAERMRLEPSAQLDSEARSTRDPQDDVLVARLVVTRNEVARLEREVAGLRGAHAQALRVANDISDLEQRFRAQRYDSRDSTFSTGLLVGALLDEVVRGVLNGGRAFDRIDRHHSWKPRPHGSAFGAILGQAIANSASRSINRSGGLFGGGSIGGGSSGHSSSSSGSFGGGGFRSGGSFGGGGHKTGGRF